VVYTHIALCLLGTLFWPPPGSFQERGWATASSGAAWICRADALDAGIAAGTWWTREVAWKNANRISNPLMPPDTMDSEVTASGIFFPAPRNQTWRNIPSKYFMKSDACQRCHADIYKQWTARCIISLPSTTSGTQEHRVMQEVAGVRSSKWCAGCHDPALLYSGLFDTPIKQIVDRPEARAASAA